MTESEREAVLRARKQHGQPWHSVPCIDSGRRAYMMTAACFEHRPHIGFSTDRMNSFRDELLAAIREMDGLEELIARVLLPDHDHFLCHATDIRQCKKDLGLLHGRTSFNWNKDENRAGRKVWFRAAETVMKSDRHYWATVNYIHRNPVRHACARAAEDWTWSSLADWRKGAGVAALSNLEEEFPVDEYGKGWDDDDLSAWKAMA
ncbi:MAG: hypothetical protein HKN82_16185 [Akkermansiaceae bacterium]|nr:hypothetical protein [Akkermansiaceae bacterium]